MKHMELYDGTRFQYDLYKKEAIERKRLKLMTFIVISHENEVCQQFCEVIKMTGDKGCIRPR